MKWWSASPLTFPYSSDEVTSVFWERYDNLKSFSAIFYFSVTQIHIRSTFCPRTFWSDESQTAASSPRNSSSRKVGISSFSKKHIQNGISEKTENMPNFLLNILTRKRKISIETFNFFEKQLIFDDLHFAN